MSTYNEIAYMIYDELGLGSDDGRFNIDHIFFLMRSFRTVLIKQQYRDAKQSIPLVDYQTICIDLEQINDCITGTSVKSVNTIPSFINLGEAEEILINPHGDLFKNLEWSLISDQRFSAVGTNKWLRNIVYFTLGSDHHLYLKSMNPNFQYIKTIEVSALFEDPLEAVKYSCNNDIDCNILDTEFPLEETLIPALVQLVYKELAKPIYIPTDNTNNASDDLSGLISTK